MATSTRKEIELRITANDLGTKTLEQLEGTLKDLTKAQEQYAKSGDAAQRSVRELRQDVADLRDLGRAVAARGALIDDFIGTEDRLNAAKQRLTQVRQSFEQFTQSLDGVKRKTKEQQETQRRLTTELAAAERQVKSLDAAFTKVQSKTLSIGVADPRAAAGQYIQFADQVGRSLAQAEGAVRDYDAALREQNRTTRVAAEQQQKLEQANRELQQSGEGLARLISFRSVGEQALETANKVSVLSTDFNALVQSARKAGDAIRTIISPSQQAITTLDGLEREVSALGDKLANAASSESTRNELRKLRTEYLSFAKDAGKAAAEIADDIGAYRRQEQALTSLRAQLEQAEASYRGLAQAVAAASVQDEAAIRRLRESEAVFRSLSGQYANEASALSRRAAALRQAGVDTANLTAAEQRLVSVARSVAQSNDLLGASFRQVGTAANNAGKGLNFFEESGRKALSISQRIRGQVLSLTASYVGLFGAINAVERIFTAGQRQQSLEVRLRVASSGDLKQVNDDLEFARRLANDLGFEFLSLAESYSKFRISAQGANVPLNQTRFIFESFTKVARAFNTTQEETNGIFRALEQILSKGKVQAEELRGQLGDRLAGAFTTFAASLGISSKQLDKLIEDGKVPAEFLLLFADEFQRRVGSELPSATKTLSAEFNRLKTNIQDALVAISGGQFEEQLRLLFESINKFLTSTDGKQFAKDLSDAFGALFAVLRKVVENFDLVLIAIKAFIALKLGSIIATIGVNFITAATAVGTFATAAAFAAARISILLGLLVGLAAVLSTSPETVSPITRAFQRFFADVEFGVRRLTAVFQIFWAIFKTISLQALSEALRAISSFIASARNRVADFVGGLLDAVGLKVAGDAVRRLKDFGEGVGDALANGLGAAAQEARQRVGEINAELESLERQYKAVLKEIDDSANPAAAPAADDSDRAAAKAAEEKKTQEDLAALRKRVQELLKTTDKEGDKIRKKSEELGRSIADDLNRFQQEILQAQDQSLEAQFQAIETKLSLFRKKLSDLRPGQQIDLGDGVVVGVEQARGIVDAYEQLLKTKAREKFFNDQIKKQQEELNKLTELRAARIADVQARVELGLITEKEGREEIRKITEESATAITEGVNELIFALVNLPPDIFAKLGGATLIKQLETMGVQLTRIKSETQILAEQFNEQIASGGADAFIALGKGIANVLAGTGKLSDAFKSAADAFRSFAADFLIQIARMIVQQLILRALQSNPYTSGIASLVTSVRHQGGMAGAAGPTRRVPAWMFANAPRLHSGGMPGLRANEVPTILERDEEVLTRKDPRHVMNGGGAGASVKIVNAFDAGSFLSAALDSPAGQQVLLNYVRNNQSTFRSALQG